jgi:hypothetical protein
VLPRDGVVASSVAVEDRRKSNTAMKVWFVIRQVLSRVICGGKTSGDFTDYLHNSYSARIAIVGFDILMACL